MTVTGTYRLQLHEGFGFADAQAQLPYLASLGVSHLYLSPVLQAVPGSMHGYDVLDHTRVSQDLGGEEGLRARSPRPPASTTSASSSTSCPTTWRWSRPSQRNAPLWDVLRAGPRRRPPRTGSTSTGSPAAAGSACPSSAAASPRPWKPATCVLGELDGQPVIRYFEHVFPVALGTEGDDVAEVAGPRSTTSWPAGASATRMLNYRRFFDVDQLIAVRVELPDVFEATHRVLLGLNHDGVVDGLPHRPPRRAGRPRGLPRPAARRRPRPGTADLGREDPRGRRAAAHLLGLRRHHRVRRHARPSRPRWSTPPPPRPWTAPGSRPAASPSLERVVDASKRQVVDRRRWSPSVEPAGPPRPRGAARRRTPTRLDEAIVELLVACEVYRAYVRPGERPSTARPQADRGRRSSPPARPGPTWSPSSSSSIAAWPPSTGDRTRPPRLRGPAAADLGTGDGQGHRGHRVLPLAPAGRAQRGRRRPRPARDAAPEPLHQWAVAPAAATGRCGMTALSTHDTKRSEDVRARLLAVAGDAESLAALLAGVRRGRRRAPASTGPPRTCSGRRWSGSATIDDERLHDYLIKAMREAKQRTAVARRRPGLRGARAGPGRPTPTAPGRPARAGRTRRRRTTPSGIRALVLGQKLLQLCLPGRPRHLPGLRARRPLAGRPRQPPPGRLRRAGEPGCARLDDGSGAATSTTRSCSTTARALRLRRGHPEVFGEGASYDPLPSTSEHALGFVRSAPQGRVASALGLGRQARVACVVTRAPHRLQQGGGWGEATIALPEGEWRDELTGRRPVRRHAAGGRRAARPPGGAAGVPMTSEEKAVREFEVWAPQAASGVELLLGDERVPLTRGDGGWWRASRTGRPRRAVLVQPRRRRPPARPALAAAARGPARPSAVFDPTGVRAGRDAQLARRRARRAA